jgi:hypothetical protein
MRGAMQAERVKVAKKNGVQKAVVRSADVHEESCVTQEHCSLAKTVLSPSFVSDCLQGNVYVTYLYRGGIIWGRRRLRATWPFNLGPE